MTASTRHLPIKETLESAWKKIHGVKAIFWKALVAAILILVLVQVISSLLYGIRPWIQPTTNLILQILGFLFQMGLLFMGIKRAQSQPFTWQSVFKSFEGYKPLHLISLYLLQLCIALIPTLILIGVSYLFQSSDNIGQVANLLIFILGTLIIYYLFLRMIMAAALVLDQDQSPWEAIKQSFHLTRGNVLRLIVLNFCQYLVMVVSTITAIGLIWGIPFVLILYGVIYQELMEYRGAATLKLKP